MHWNPIETAPKDGTRILAVEDGNVLAVIWGNRRVDYNDIFCSLPDGWVIWNGDIGPVAINPTHWMPLPEPPEGA